MIKKMLVLNTYYEINIDDLIILDVIDIIMVVLKKKFINIKYLTFFISKYNLKKIFK